MTGLSEYFLIFRALIFMMSISANSAITHFTLENKLSSTCFQHFHWGKHQIAIYLLTSPRYLKEGLCIERTTRLGYHALTCRRVLAQMELRNVQSKGIKHQTNSLLICISRYSWRTLVTRPRNWIWIQWLLLLAFSLLDSSLDFYSFFLSFLVRSRTPVWSNKKRGETQLFPIYWQF